jgi:hypothetical protein
MGEAKKIEKQITLEEVLYRTQKKIVRENKLCQLQFEKSLVQGIKARMAQVRAVR